MPLSGEAELKTPAVKVFLGLGSNLGNRQGNLNRAIGLLEASLQLGMISSVYETEPVGDTAQPRFLNMAIEAKTGLEPRVLLELAKEIEKKMGRKSDTGQPRVIDIDILLYGDEVLETASLTIPHPKMAERAFVLEPLAEITPDTPYPGTYETINDLLLKISGRQGVIKSGPRPIR
ncbi:2-amino-4-hydroxy-6-hydroxymethyldihydropteridine diphosphokinase [Chloroflexota bacterium]